jgi:hypothetical protein
LSNDIIAGECGHINLLNKLVRLGVDVKPGAWPWLAALYVRTTEGSNFSCGAALVTIKHVITGVVIIGLEVFTH